MEKKLFVIDALCPKFFTVVTLRRDTTPSTLIYFFFRKDQHLHDSDCSGKRQGNI